MITYNIKNKIRNKKWNRKCLLTLVPVGLGRLNDRRLFKGSIINYLIFLELTKNTTEPDPYYDPEKTATNQPTNQPTNQS